MGLILTSPQDAGEGAVLCILYCSGSGSTSLQYKQVPSEKEYRRKWRSTYGTGGFRVGMGAEAIQELLRAINLEKDSADLQKGAGGFHRTARQNYQEAGGSGRHSLPQATVLSG